MWSCPPCLDKTSSVVYVLHASLQNTSYVLEMLPPCSKKKNPSFALFQSIYSTCWKAVSCYNSSLLPYVKKRKWNSLKHLAYFVFFSPSRRKQSGRSSMMRPGDCVTSDSSSPFSRSLNQLATERKRSSTERLVRGFYSSGSTGSVLALLYCFILYLKYLYHINSTVFFIFFY